MPGTLQPLDQKFAIVDAQGRPTDYFTRWAQQRQIDIGDSITLGDLQAYLTDHALIEGSGIQLSPSGDLNDHVTIAADVQEILDQISATRGTIIYRGLLGWSALLPGTSGFFLKTNGPGADPAWAAGGGGGTGTPVVRNSTIQSSSASSYVVPWPAGTIAGDVVIIFMEHGFSPNVPAGWTTINRNTSGTAQGMTIAKVMTAADITAGSVTVTASGAFNGSIAAVTIDGTTMGSINQNVQAVGTGLNVSAGVPASPTNLILGFGGWRANSVVSFDANWTNLSTISAANASGTLAKYTGAPNPLGAQATIASTVSGTFYYSLLSLIGV